MPLVPDGARAGLTLPRPPPTLVNLGREEINPDAMDNVIMRLFTELNKQLAQMESAKAEQLTVADRERHARILSNLERTLERLNNLEAGRAAARKSQASVRNESKREVLIRKLTVLIETREAEERERGADGR
jgi:TolA-binding protein